MHAFVITGFLGVGKTTMLTNTVKNYFQDKKIAIVVNEFGDVGIDGTLLKNVHSEVLEISEGCICCKLAEEFESGVNEIIAKYDPEIIFVETSGASEPFPIFLSLNNLGIHVEGVICVCDAKNFESYKDNDTAKYQIGGSNVLVMNKTDLVSDAELDAVKADVAAIKAQYNIKNTLTGEAIFSDYVIYAAQQGIVNKEVFEGMYGIDEIVTIADHPHRHDHTASDAITQQAVYLKEEILFEDIETLLHGLHDRKIYRVKGVVKTKDVPSALVVNYAFGNVSYDELSDFPAQSILIFIGEGIEDEVKRIAETYAFVSIPKFRLQK